MEVNLMEECEKIKSLYKKFYEMAYTSKLIERKRKINGENLVDTIIKTNFEYVQPSLENYCTMFEIITGEQISRQSFDEKINEKMIFYLKSLLEEILKASNVLNILLINCPKLLKAFDKIYVLDSTGIELNNNFVTIFRGSGGSASKSAVKIQHLYEARSNTTKYIEITSGVVPDNKYAIDNDILLDGLEEGSLFLADLGYFSTRFFDMVDKHGLYYVSRLPSGEINIYSSKYPDKKIDLVKLLKANQGKIIDINVLITSRKFPCRLVITPLPKDVADERARKKNMEFKRKGKTPSDYLKYTCHYTMMITNIPYEIIPAKDIYNIYRIRWSVELSFKVWKTKFHIDKISAIKDINRVLFELYGKMLCIFLMYYFISLSRGRAMETDDISMYKAYSIIKLSIISITYMLFQDDIGLEDVIQKLNCLLKRKCNLTKTRKRKSTMEKLCTYSKGGYYVVNNSLL